MDDEKAGLQTQGVHTLSLTCIERRRVHLFALLISTCILPYVDAVGSRHTVNPEAVRESPHVRFTNTSNSRGRSPRLLASFSSCSN